MAHSAGEAELQYLRIGIGRERLVKVDTGMDEQRIVLDAYVCFEHLYAMPEFGSLKEFLAERSTQTHAPYSRVKRRLNGWLMHN